MPDFFFDYSDLESLCAERELETSETHATNDFYGQASVLKRYCGLAESGPLKAVLEHGINLDDQMWDHDQDSEMPVNFSPSRWRADVVQKLSNKKSVPIGFGYLYAQSLLDQAGPASQSRRGTLAFPCHSTHSIRAIFDHDRYAETLLSLPAFMQPVSVCLYWKNYLMGEQVHYERRGINVYSAGHMFDPDFLLRLHDLCRVHRFATSNEVGSHLFLTVSSGCRFVFTDSDPIDWEIPDAEVGNCAKQNQLFQARCQQARNLFGSRIESRHQSELTPEQENFVAELVGRDCFLSPKQLRDQIKQAESVYRWQHWKTWAKKRLSKIGRIGKSIAKRLPWKKSA